TTFPVRRPVVPARTAPGQAEYPAAAMASAAATSVRAHRGERDIRLSPFGYDKTRPRPGQIAGMSGSGLDPDESVPRKPGSGACARSMTNLRVPGTKGGGTPFHERCEAVPIGMPRTPRGAPMREKLGPELEKSQRPKGERRGSPGARRPLCPAPGDVAGGRAGCARGRCSGKGRTGGATIGAPGPGSTGYELTVSAGRPNRSEGVRRRHARERSGAKAVVPHRADRVVPERGRQRRVQHERTELGAGAGAEGEHVLLQRRGHDRTARLGAERVERRVASAEAQREPVGHV